MRYFTFKRQALARLLPGQVLRFTEGKGYWLFGRFVLLTMYDSVDTAQIPASAEAVAGYVSGNWKTYPSLARLFPHAHKLSIATNADADAECLDIEQGDALPGQAPDWLKRQYRRGIAKPVIYGSVSAMPEILRVLGSAGIPREHVRLWTAHYTGRPHRCDSSCGFGFTGVADATQYTNRALGRNLDASLCGPHFF